jgi:hypothetical protein
LQYQNYKKYINIALLTAIFAGCSTNTVVPFANKSGSIPTWYINSPKNSSIFLYGLGEGYSIREAKENALNDMASRLTVSIGSDIKTKVKVSHGSINGYSKNIIKNIEVEVQKIKFTNAKVYKSKQVDDKFYIIMQIDKEQFLEHLLKEFKVLDERLTKRYNSLKSYSLLEQINILEELKSDIIKAKKDSIVIGAIDNNFDYLLYIKKYNNYIDTIDSLKNSSTIYVKTNLQKKYFLDQLIDLINQKGYKVSKDGANIEVALDNKVRYSLARGWHIARVSTAISIISSGKVISSKVINSIGRSSSTKENALQNASENFRIKILKDGLEKIIFSK